MTDKQIIEDCPHFILGCCQEYLDGVCENHKCDLKIIRELEQKLKAKEQECERLNRWLPIISRLEMALGSYEKAKAIDYKSYIEQIFAELDQLKFDSAELEKRHNDSFEQFKQLKAENEELKKTIQLQNKMQMEVCEEKNSELYQLKQTLTEIKPILEFYANSKMGEEQPDRTYKILLSGGCIMAYDPKPAREALRKINEVENDRT